MLRKCTDEDFDSIYEIINDGASVYQGVIPRDRWKTPYMSRDELKHEIEDGVVFWTYEDHGELLGVMGIQPVQDVTLIRHSYVRTAHQHMGIGGILLTHLCENTSGPILIGTWADAIWAIMFYEKYGFLLVSREEKDQLLKKYWSIPERQIETSVVLSNQKWER